jgi:hypothetical protein
MCGLIMPMHLDVTLFAQREQVVHVVAPALAARDDVMHMQPLLGHEAAVPAGVFVAFERLLSLVPPRFAEEDLFDPGAFVLFAAVAPPPVREVCAAPFAPLSSIRVVTVFNRQWEGQVHVSSLVSSSNWLSKGRFWPSLAFV